MFNTLFLILAQNQLFWKARKSFSRFAFFCNQRIFGVKYRVREGSITTKSVLSILKIIVGQLVLAIFITVFLQITNTYLVPLSRKIDFTMPNVSSYRTLLESVIGVGAVFIGLYYAAISAIGSAIYAKVPNNIRGLLAQERFGNAYMRTLALFTSFSVCLLAFHTAGFEPIILAIPLLILGAILMIFGFIRLGARAFNLFDPINLSSNLFVELQHLHRQVQVGGYRWSDQSFQHRFHKIAQGNIDTLATLSEIAAKESHLNGRPFTSLCNNLLLFLRNYERKRKLIPTNSLWYRQRYEHSDWYQTGDTETFLAHETATGLQPKVVSDPRWVESLILPIVQLCLEINIKESRYSIVNELFNYLDIYVQQLASEHQVEYAFDVIGKIFSSCKDLIFAEGEELIIEESLEHMRICKHLATLPINVLLAYTRSLEGYGQNTIRQRIRSINWQSEKSIYRAKFAVHILPRLEWMHSRLAFEKRIEGKIISAPWYLQELITQQEAENLCSVMTCLCEKNCELYEHWIEVATSTKHPWLKAVIVSTEWEYWNKFKYNMNTLNQLWNNLNSDQRIEGLPWPNLDFDELIAESGEREKELLKLMSEENLLLSLISRPQSYPDFTGQFLHTVGEASFIAMCENDCEMVETLFKRYFGGSLLQFQKLRPNELGTDQQSLNNLKIAAAPLLDLMDISGYAYLLSDYHDTPHLKEPIVEAWDKYLNEEQENQRLQSLAAATSLSESGFEIEHRGINRTRWKQMIQRLLANVERQEIPPDPNRITIDPEPRTAPVHESALVMIFAGRSDPFPYTPYDGIDIFLAKYIRQRQSEEDLDFGWRRRRDLEAEIRREENRDMRH